MNAEFASVMTKVDQNSFDIVQGLLEGRISVIPKDSKREVDVIKGVDDEKLSDEIVKRVMGKNNER